MRQALGTAVFFGMIGVTFFGVFLTPVFYTVIRTLVTAKTHPPKDRCGAWTGGCTSGANMMAMGTAFRDVVVHHDSKASGLP